MFDDLKKIISGDIATDDTTLEKYSRDYSIFKVRPQAVVFPRNSEDVKKLVKFATKNKIPLTARSAGTDMTGGPLGEGIIVNFTKYFNRIKEIRIDPSINSGNGSTGSPQVLSPERARRVEGHPSTSSGDNNAYAIVEPGVYFRDFDVEISKRGLMYPPYPASKDICALGGMVANNSGGEKTLAYGKTEDYVLELKVVMSDGEEHVVRPLQGVALKKKLSEKNFEGETYRKIYNLLQKNHKEIQAAKPNVSKNSAGYQLWRVLNEKVFDPTQLFVGSQGTLGIITEAKLRLLKKKKYRKVAVVFLPSLAPVANMVVDLLRFKPESLESYDDKTLKVALKFLPLLVRSMKGSFFKLIWQFVPEAFMVLRGGLPKMVMIMVLSSDNQEELSRRLEPFNGLMRRRGFQGRILRDDTEAEKYWTIRRQSFKLLHDYTTGKDTAPFIDDFIVQPEYLPVVLPKVNAILDEYKDKLIYTIAGHPGDGNFHIIPLMDLRRPEVRAIIPEISERIYDLILKYQGSITAEHNDGLVRTPYLEKMYGKKIVKLFADVKKIFDPKNIFNPGKKVGGSLDYALKKITSTV
ncbi:MAG: FAD-binding oxidoreductase [Patescibacteria group bacterium]